MRQQFKGEGMCSGRLNQSTRPTQINQYKPNKAKQVDQISAKASWERGRYYNREMEARKQGYPHAAGGRWGGGSPGWGHRCTRTPGTPPPRGHRPSTGRGRRCRVGGHPLVLGRMIGHMKDTDYIYTPLQNAWGSPPLSLPASARLLLAAHSWCCSYSATA